MKPLYFFYSLLIAAVMFSCSKDILEGETPGSISGTVSDRTTGEPVSTVKVSLEPGGKSTVTGSDGTFTFRNLESDSYTLTVTKEGYKQATGKVTVRPGDPTPAHLLIERIPAYVTADRDLLDFGSNASTNTLSFNIVNPGYVDLEWEIEERCDWITEVKPSKGTLKYGKTEAIVVVIDRELLKSGVNETVIVVRSSNGSSEVKVTAAGSERYVAKLNTLESSAITSTSAVLNGEILDPGMPAYTERGFVYSLNPMPTFENMLAKLTAPVNEEAKYSYELRGLTLGEKYYVRAYAVNSVGTAYSSNEINFTTVASAPELTVQDVTEMNVSKASATLNGTVVKAGDPACFERGFVYSTESNPTVNNTKIKANGTGVGMFSVSVSDLTLNQRYYVRAYAISKINDSEQVVYSSSQVDFTLKPTAPQLSIEPATNVSITNGTATFNGTISSVGEPAYTERGFVYGLYSNPTIDDERVAVSGTGAGAFRKNITGLQLDCIYYVRAYAINVAGTFYSAETTVSTMAILPEVTTMEIDDYDLSGGTATFKGMVISAGEPAYTERGFVYSTMPEPTIYDNKIVVNGEGVTGSFSKYVTDLPTTDYYVRAYATNRGGTSYGEEQHVQEARWVVIPEANIVVQLEDLGCTTWENAYALCEASRIGGYTDWRLPTLTELQMMYKYKARIGNFNESYNSSYYWSSTVYSVAYNRFYYVKFYDGNTDYNNSYVNYNVRAVRTLNK